MINRMDERDARLLLNGVPGLGSERPRRLLERFGSASAFWAAPPSEWEKVEGVAGPIPRRLEKALEQAETFLKTEKDAMARQKLRVIVPDDAEFPSGLKAIPDAPLILYVAGEIRPVDSLAVAMVGTRLATPYGRAVAERLAGDLARAGVTIVSGLARGIDTVVHGAALKHRARTVGVIGSGFDRFYPPENKTFVEKMAKQGAVLSEFPMSTPPDRQNFPRRNRLISALSLAVVVVEADETSGALITARLAAEQGRDVFAVPGSIFSKFSRGPHRLLKQGARPVETVEDILDEIEAFRRLIRRPRPAAVSTPPLTGVEGALMAHLSLEPLGVDTLASRSGLAVPAVLSALLELELKGLVRSLPGQTYVRAAAAA